MNETLNYHGPALKDTKGRTVAWIGYGRGRISAKLDANERARYASLFQQAPALALELEGAAIDAHMGYRHAGPFGACDYVACASRRTVLSEAGHSTES